MHYGPQSPSESKSQRIDDVLLTQRECESQSVLQASPEIDDTSPAVSVVRKRLKRLRIDEEKNSESSRDGDRVKVLAECGRQEKRRCTDVSSDTSSIGSSQCGDISDDGIVSPRRSDNISMEMRLDRADHHRREQLQQLLKEQMAKYRADYRSLSEGSQIDFCCQRDGP